MRVRIALNTAVTSALAAAGLVSFSAGEAHALNKAANSTALNVAGSWTENTVPGTSDVLIFGATGVPSASGLSVAVGVSGFLGGSVQVTDIAGPLTITQSNGQTWTLSTGGIDMSTATANVTIGNSGTSAYVRWASANFGGINITTGRTLTFNSNLSNQGNTKTLSLNGGGNIVFNGTASSGGGGAMSWDLLGGTSLTLNGPGGWATGNDVINGTLNIGADNALGTNALGFGGTNSSNPTITAVNGARVVANNINLNAVSVLGNQVIAGSNALTLSGQVLVNGADRTLSVNNSALTTLGGTVALSENTSNRRLTLNGSGNVTISGVVTNGAGGATAANLTYAGNGVLSLTNANTFGGTLAANSGTVRIDNASAAQNATVAVGATNAVTFGAGITGATFGGLGGASDLALTNADSNPVTLTVGNNNVSASYGGVLSGTGSLVKVGNGTQTLNGANANYVNGILLNAGTLAIGTFNGAGGTSNTITAADGTTIAATNGVAGGSVASAISLSGANANVTLTNNNASGGFASVVTGTANQTLTISNAGGTVVNLNSTSKQLQNFLGTVQVGSGQSLGFRATSLNNGSDNATFNVDGSVSTRNGGALALGALTGSGTLGSGTSGTAGTTLTYTVGAKSSVASAFSGVIKDGDSTHFVALTKTGSNTLTLSGANTYSGDTLVNGGKLVIDGTNSGTGIVSVGPTATLGGSGTIAGAVGGAGLLSPGNSPGILTAGSIDPSAGQDYAFELAQLDPVYNNAAASGNDVLRLTSTTPLLNPLGASNTVSVYLNVAGALEDGDTFRGAFFTDADEAFAASLAAGDFVYYVQDAAGSVSFNNQSYSLLSNEYTMLVSTVAATGTGLSGGGNDGYVTQFQVAVPEPASLAALAIGGFAMLGRRRRAS